jgi:acyl-CoA thioester hydrolase
MFVVSAEAVDVHGHVNNLEYLKWMQEIAIEHSALQGWPVDRYMQLQASWFIRSHSIEYLQPGFAEDEITHGTWVAAIHDRTSPRRHLFIRRADRAILARAETMWTFIDLKTGRTTPIPEELGSAFEIVDSDEKALEIMLSEEKGAGRE